MTLPFGNGMRDAVRLTKDGKLGDAVKRIQETLSGQVRREGKEEDEARTVNIVSPRLADSPWTPPATGGFRPEPDEKAQPTRDHAPHQDQPVEAIGTFSFRSYSNAAGHRRYKLYIPAKPSDQPQPLIIMLHGCTQSPDDFAAGTRMNQWAETFGFVVAYPEQTSSANQSKCWNWFNAADQKREQGEPSILAGITRQIIADQKIDPARVYVCGLSAGGAAAAIMGQTYPDLFEAVGIHSGLACGAASDMMSGFTAMKQGGKHERSFASKSGKSPRAIIFHGDKDGTVNAVNGEQASRQFRAGADQSETVEGERNGKRFTQTRYFEANGQTKVERWLVHGIGHAWCGGSSAGNFTSPAGPDASREMIRFFFRQVISR